MSLYKTAIQNMRLVNAYSKVKLLSLHDSFNLLSSCAQLGYLVIVIARAGLTQNFIFR